MKYVIVGSGPAGIFAAEAVRKRDPEGPVVMLTADRDPAHSPVTLSYWMAGGSPRDVLFFRNASWAEQMRIDLRTGAAAVSLNPALKRLALLDAAEVDYDRLLIATGATPISLPIPGVNSKGVACLRTVQDAEAILHESPAARNVVIIGGGFIGLKLACHLNERGLRVVVLERESRLAFRMFDLKASRMVEDRLRENGIEVEAGVEVAELIEENGMAAGVRMRDGRTFASQRVVQGVGVRPNIQWLTGSGIHLKGGIPVNSQTETNLAGIYAAGDVAITADSISSEWVNNATWPSATRQGIVAGTNMAGGSLAFIHNFAMNSLSLFGLRVMAAGHSYYEEGTGHGIDVHSEEGDGIYRKLVTKEGRLIGFILIGDVSGAGLLLSRMKRQDKIGSPGRRLPPNLGYCHGNIFRSAT
jgi:nitrite reductase (NADH) large subunit